MAFDIGIIQSGGRDIGPLQSAGGETVEPSSIDSAESWGSPTIVPGEVTVSPDSIDSEESFGGASIGGNIDIDPGSIASEESFGEPEVIFTPQTVNPDSIDSAESFGSPTLTAGQVVSPSSIASAEDWGTANVAGPVNPSSIPSTESFGDPNVCGPVNPDSIASAESFGEPTANVKQTVNPGTIASAESWGAPRVANVETIRPASIDSAEDWGEPSASITTAPILPASIESGESWGDAAVNGGEQTLQVFVGNIDRSRWLLRGSASLREQSLGRWSAGLTFLNTPGGDMDALGTSLEWRPRLGMTVVVKEYNRTLFRGCIREMASSPFPGTPNVQHVCQLIDKAGICDRRRIRRSYPASSEPHAEQWDIADVIRDIVANYLNGEGIAVGDDIPATLGLLVSPLQAYITVTQAFDELTKQLGYVSWTVDLIQQLRFIESYRGEAPFQVTESSQNWRNLQVVETDRDYRNSETILSNRVADGTRTDEYTLDRWGDRPNADIQPSIYDDEGGYQFRAFDYGFQPTAILLKFTIGSIISAKLNGDSVTIKSAAELTSADVAALAAGTSRIWVYQPFSGVVYVHALASEPHYPLNSPGDVITIEYYPAEGAVNAASEEVDRFTIDEPLESEAGESFGTCGSGRYEHVEQVNDVFTTEAGAALATKLLELSSEMSKLATFTTDEPGAEIGQRIYLDVPRMNAEDQYFHITGIEATSTDGMDRGRGSSFEWKITASNRPDMGNWLKVWERLFRRTMHPSPTTALDKTKIVLGSGRSLRAGEEMNPGVIDKTGRLVDVDAVFIDPPQDQDLTIDIKIAGVSIFPNGSKLVIPADETGHVKVTEFAVSPFYGYLDQVITVDIAYRVTGANPVAAKNGTVTLRWAV